MMTRGSVLHLFRKVSGAARGEPVARLHFSASGIVGSRRYSPLRQILITDAVEIQNLGYSPGALHENIVVDFTGLHELASGAVLAIGDALVQLTFHCEPCSVVQKPGESLRPLLHRRGVLGKFLNDGVIERGDDVSLTGRNEEHIPYESKERIAWFLAKRTKPISASELLFEVGLPSGYARALPAILRKLPLIPEDRVVFASKRSRK